MSQKSGSTLRALVTDVETTTRNKGHPFSKSNKLCAAGFYDGNKFVTLDVEHSGTFNGGAVKSASALVADATLLIGFAFKFDLHWLRKYGIITDLHHIHVWDCQLVHFIISGQKEAMPSLNDVCTFYGLPLKHDVVATEYWDNGLDTTAVPWGILDEYLIQDLNLEWQVYQKQIEYLKDKPQLKKLCWWACQDLKVTEEMEWNGLKYDIELSKKMGDDLLAKVAMLDADLAAFVDVPGFNWGSGEHLSACLYGGVVRAKVREAYVKTLKSGLQKFREHWTVKETILPRIVQPLEKSELAKDGYWSTDEGTLKILKATGPAKQIIDLLLARRGLMKQVGTYFHGFPELYEEMEWQDNILHGKLDHVRTATGRLASNKPNQQNLEEEVRKCLVSRFSTSPKPSIMKC